LKQGVSKSKKEPYALAAGDTLEVKVDGQAVAQVVLFTAADFADIKVATAIEVVAKLTPNLKGVTADVDGGAVRLVSASSDANTTAIEVSGGTAREKLGFDGRRYGARLLGVTQGARPHTRTAPDTIDLPHCPDCGAKECLVRTWDAVAVEHSDTLHARHRRAVNALAQHLKSHGFSDADARAVHAAEVASPPDVEMVTLTASVRTLPSARPPPRRPRGGA
jgi:predicted nucleic acid-binding Zn ribbon protein